MDAHIVHTVIKNRDSMLRLFVIGPAAKIQPLHSYHIRQSTEWDVQSCVAGSDFAEKGREHPNPLLHPTRDTLKHLIELNSTPT